MLLRRSRLPNLARAALPALLLSAAVACGGAEGAPSGAGASSGAGGAGAAPATGGAGGGLPQIDAGPPCSPDVPRTVPVSISLGPEEGDTPFVESLSKAKTSIRVMVYMMGYGGILDTLKQKAGAGVSVRVILDVSQIDVNQKYFDALTAAGAEVRWSDPGFKYMHAKAFVVDDAEAVISTGNYSLSLIKKERNFNATDADPADVATVAAIFDADWDKKSPDLSCTRLLVSPVNARERLLDLIGSATSTLDIESMQFADTEVREAVAARAMAGVSVRVLLADPAWIDANADGAAFLAAKGIPARYMVSPGVHVKAIVADGARAYMGSENLSWTSLEKNREIGLIVLEADGVKTMHDTFESDWGKATSF